MAARPSTIALFILASLLCCSAAWSSDALLDGFKSPPNNAKPRVWWHWMNGNVTREGIDQDLQWMKRIGIGGVQQFDAAFVERGGVYEIPQLVDPPLRYMSPEWQRMMRYSVERASHLGLEFAVASSAGWTLTGGPLVQPYQAMKKLVWSETVIPGEAVFRGNLPRPPDATGNFQGIPLVGDDGAKSVRPTFYADVAVIAYRTPPAEFELENAQPRVTTNTGEVDSAALFDGDLTKGIEVTLDANRACWVQLEFARPVRVQALSVVIDRPTGHGLLAREPRGRLEVLENGRVVRTIPTGVDNTALESSALEKTVAFDPVVGSVFRLMFEMPKEDGGSTGKSSSTVVLAELHLHGGARVNRFEDKAGYSTKQIRDADDTPSVTSADVIDPGDVVDLTRNMRTDGYLHWRPPAGRWTILRFGYSLTGRVNEPAPQSGTGLEVDKLDGRHVEYYLNGYLDKFEQTLGSELVGKRGLTHVVMDSYEAGPQNWTEHLPAQFEERRNYSLRKWMPVLAGRVIGSARASDRFLWDFRKTLGELMADMHYAQVSESLRKRGLQRYGESQEYSRMFIGDGMEMKRTADIPMGAAWTTPDSQVEPNYEADLRESASVAHVYGKNVVAAEAFTAVENPYGFTPEDLKPLADQMMAMGVNRFVIHTSVHQPDNRLGPGVGLGPIGQWFTRKETWAEQAGPWMKYLARSSFLLQQGRAVAEVAYLYGEDTNVTSLLTSMRETIPPGYSFDFINPDTLLKEVRVQGGRLSTSAGARYRLLALDQSTRRMSVPVLRVIRYLVHAGAVVVGERPIESPSLADDEGEFRALVADLWGDAGARREVGKGRIAERSIEEALRELNVQPDLEAMRSSARDLNFIHRRLSGGDDLYFVVCRRKKSWPDEVSFRVTGRRPELWIAKTGEVRPLGYRASGGRTTVFLRPDESDAVFVLFRRPTRAASELAIVPRREVLATLSGPWDVTFQAGRGAPGFASFDNLISWTEKEDEGIRYFSGTASYAKTFDVRPQWANKAGRIYIDLGSVKNIAEVLVNGRSVGTVWDSPFRVDISHALRPGQNDLMVRVTNLWPNRLIGDKQPGALPIAYATFSPFEADSALLPSGLLGPVELLAERDASRAH